VNFGGLQFTIYPKGVLSDLGKFFGMQDIEIGHSHFDEQMIIQGNDQERIRKLFANTEMRDILLWLCSHSTYYVLTVKDDEGWFAQEFPKGVDELYFENMGLITNKDVLRGLVKLFAETLDQMVRIGAAGIQKPPIDVS